MTLGAGFEADVFGLTAELVDIASVSHHEKEIADFVEARLRAFANGLLEIERLGDNVLARTSFGHPSRLMLAGHLDTVPPNGNERAKVDGDVVSGLGSVDMKGGLAVFLEVARALCAADDARRSVASDLTLVFYVCEEVDRKHSGLVQIEAADPGWLEADAAVLGEPTSALVEAGCQGVLRVLVETRGERAHTARPWMGRNAIHRLGSVLDAAAAYEARRPVIDGCEYREALQAVAIEGGVANNVVPDTARLRLNHRFAPDRSVGEAFDAVRSLVEHALESGAEESGADYTITLEDSADAALPGLSHPLLAALVEASSQAPRAKLGWTDVSFFSSRGVPAANFGPGDPTLAHNAGEKVHRDELVHAFDALCSVIS